MYKFTITKPSINIPQDIISHPENLQKVLLFPPLSFPPDSTFDIPPNWNNFNTFAFSREHNFILAGNNNNWEEIGQLSYQEITYSYEIDPEAF